MLSVALSLTIRPASRRAFQPVGVTHRRVLWSPDFPPAALKTADDRPARFGVSGLSTRLDIKDHRDAPHAHSQPILVRLSPTEKGHLRNPLSRSNFPLQGRFHS